MKSTALSAILLLLATPLAGIAQTVTGAVRGTITDPSGAVVAGAKVTATNVDTGVDTSEVTGASGTYSIRFLQIGQYKLTVEAHGFAISSYGPFTLEIDQTASLDLPLKPGSETTTVTVSDQLQPILNTENGTLATTFDATTIENIPLNGRNFSSLTVFLPGSVTTEPGSLTGANATERDTSSSGQAAINGNRLQTNNYLLDGIEINETINNLIGYNPNPDALAEVKVISANAQAEYGNVNGGDVIAQTKSGTNQYHGSVSGFLENYNLDANTWGNKHQSPVIDRNPYTQSIFSGTFGGPIKRDKLFFFVDYEGMRYHHGGTGTATVLSSKMRSGDFSELLDESIMCADYKKSPNSCTNSKLIQLYDPNNNFAAYSNNQIPINSSAAAYLIANPSIYPEPNATPQAGSPMTNNYQGPNSSQRRNDQGDVKVDWTPTTADRISVRYSQGEASDSSVNALAVSFPGASGYPFKGTAVNWVHTVSPTIVNQFRAGFSRIRWDQGDPIDTTGVFGYKGNSLLGIPGSQAFQGFSALNMGQSGNIGNSAGGTNFIDNIFSYIDDFTVQRGKHLFKAGVQFIRYQQNNFYPGNDGALGQFNYNGNYTSNPSAPSGSDYDSAAGYSVADFVLDRSSFVGVGSVAGRTGQRQWRSAYYVQDDWKLMPNFTLNLGLRYEFDQPIYEVNNKEANINLETAQVEYAGSIPSANTVSGATVCATRACYNATYSNLMPRLGFALQANPRLVVRGGYGITNYLEGTGANLRLTYNPPFQGSFEETGSAPSTTSAGTSFRVEDGFSSSGGSVNYSGSTYRAYRHNLKPAFINQYSLTTEYQINNASSLTVGYVGESGQHLILAMAENQLHSPCTINGVLQSNPNSTACTTADPAPYSSIVGQSGGVVGTESEGMMNYNALQVSYRQRDTHGLQYTINYTFARAMTNTLGFFGIPSISGPSAYAENAYDNGAEYGPVGQDIRNGLNGTLVFAVPFGRGKEYGAHINPLVDEALGGWRVAATAVVYSGFPVTPYDNNNNAYTNNKTQRPNQIRKLKIVHHSINNWFGDDASATACAQGANNDNGACAFQQPTDGTYGNARVGSLRGPGYQQYDFAGFKDFHLYHEYAIGFRAEAFNALNISSYSNPDSTVQDTTFGQITSVRSPQRQIQFSASFKF